MLPEIETGWDCSRGNLFYESVRRGRSTLEWPEVVVVLEGHPEIRASFTSEDLEADNMTPLGALRRLITSVHSPVTIETLPYTDPNALALFRSGHWWFQGCRGVVPRQREMDTFRRHALRNGVQDRRLEHFDHPACFPQSTYSMEWHDPSDMHHCDMRGLRKEADGADIPTLTSVQEGRVCRAAGVAFRRPKGAGWGSATLPPAGAAAASTGYSARRILSLLRKAKQRAGHPTPLVLLAVPVSRPPRAPQPPQPAAPVAGGEPTPPENPLLCPTLGGPSGGEVSQARLRCTGCPEDPLSQTAWNGDTPVHFAARADTPGVVVEMLRKLWEAEGIPCAGAAVAAEEGKKKKEEEEDDGSGQPRRTPERRVAATAVLLLHSLNMSHRSPFDVALQRGSQGFIIEVLSFLVENRAIHLLLRSELQRVVRGSLRCGYLRCVEFFFSPEGLGRPIVDLLRKPLSEAIEETHREFDLMQQRQEDAINEEALRGNIEAPEILPGFQTFEEYLRDSPISAGLVVPAGVALLLYEESMRLPLDAELLSQVKDPEVLRAVESHVEWGGLLDLTPFFRTGRVSAGILRWILSKEDVLHNIDKKLKWKQALCDLVRENCVSAIEYLLGGSADPRVARVVRSHISHMLQTSLISRAGRKANPGGFQFRSAACGVLFSFLLSRTVDGECGSCVGDHILIRGPKYPYPEQHRNCIALAIETGDMDTLHRVLQRSSLRVLQEACVISKQSNRHLVTVTPVCYAFCLRRQEAFNAILSRIQCLSQAAENPLLCSRFAVFRSDEPWDVPPQRLFGDLPSITEGRRDLPGEVWCLVASFLLPESLGVFQGACRGFHDLVSFSDLWADAMPYLHRRSQSLSASYRKAMSKGIQPLPDARSIGNPQHIFRHAYQKGVYSKNCGCIAGFLPSAVAEAGSASAGASTIPLHGFTRASSPLSLGGGASGRRALFVLPGSALPPGDPHAAASEIEMLLSLYEAERDLGAGLHPDSKPPPQATSPPAGGRRGSQAAGLLPQLRGCGGGPAVGLHHTKLVPDLEPVRAKGDLSSREGLYYHSHPLVRLFTLWGVMCGGVAGGEAALSDRKAELEARLLRTLDEELAGARHRHDRRSGALSGGVSPEDVARSLEQRREQGDMLDPRTLLGSFWLDEARGAPPKGSPRSAGGSSCGSSSSSCSSSSSSCTGDGGDGDFTSFAGWLHRGGPRRLPDLAVSVLGEAVRHVKDSEPLLRAVWQLCAPDYLANPGRYQDVHDGSILSHALRCNNEMAVFFLLDIGGRLREAAAALRDASEGGGGGAARLTAADFSFGAGEDVAGLNDCIFQGDSGEGFLRDVLAGCSPEEAHRACGGAGEVNPAVLQHMVRRQFTLGRSAVLTAALWSGVSVLSAVAGSLAADLRGREADHARWVDTCYDLRASMDLSAELPVLPVTLFCAVHRGSEEGLLVLAYIKELVGTMRNLGGVVDGLHERGFLCEYERIVSASGAFGSPDVTSGCVHVRNLCPTVARSLSGAFRSCIRLTCDSDDGVDSLEDSHCIGAVHEANILACFLGREKFLVTSLLSGYYDCDSTDAMDEGCAVQQSKRIRQLFLAAASGKQNRVLRLLEEVFVEGDDRLSGSARHQARLLVQRCDPSVRGSANPDTDTRLWDTRRVDIRTAEADDSSDEGSELDPDESGEVSTERASMLAVGEPRRLLDLDFNVMALPCIDCSSPYTSDVMLGAIASYVGSWRAQSHDLLARSLLAVERTPHNAAPPQLATPAHYPLAPARLCGGPLCLDLFEAVTGRGWGVISSHSRSASGSWHTLHVKNLSRYSRDAKTAPLVLTRRLQLSGGVGGGSVSIPVVARVYHPRPYAPVRFVQIVLTAESAAAADENPQYLTAKADEVLRTWRHSRREPSLYVFVAPSGPGRYDIRWVATPTTTQPLVLKPVQVSPDCFKKPRAVYYRSEWDRPLREAGVVEPGNSLLAYEAETDVRNTPNVAADPSLVSVLELPGFHASVPEPLQSSALAG